MRIYTIAAIAGAAATALVTLPALLLARRLDAGAFRVKDPETPSQLDLQVTAIGDETITLRRGSKSPSIQPDAPGRYLLEGARGRGFTGRVIESNEVIAIREYRHFDGVTRAGDYARLDGYAFPDDPEAAHGYQFEDIRFSSPLGEFPAWYVPGKTETWAVLTHGKGADRREALRILPALVDSGFHCLAITYRNDAECAPAPGNRYAYGRDEWEELDGAVAYALAHGARDVVLVGYSMGGGITYSFMANSSHAGSVSALILDAPMSNLQETVTFGARRAGIPTRFLPVSNAVSAFVYRFRWSDFDYLKTLDALRVPVLLFHGDADTTIPVELSDTVAAARSDLVRYVRVPGAGHVRAWNVEPETYIATVREFIKTRRSVGAQ